MKNLVKSKTPDGKLKKFYTVNFCKDRNASGITREEYDREWHGLN